MLNIIVPAAGRGSRFVEAGYKDPKPLIPVLGTPMVSRVIKNVKPSSPHQFTILMQKEHALQGRVAGIYDCRLMLIEGVTQGAACTVLLAKEFIDNDDPLLIVNSDQLLDFSVDRFLETAGPWDGAIATFTSTSPAYSYAKTEDGFVVEVAEKRVISDQATAGAYWWRRGRDFVRFAEEAIANDDRTLGEFYVAPLTNYLIRSGGKVIAYPVERVHALGTPADLEAYLGLRQPLTQSA